MDQDKIDQFNENISQMNDVMNLLRETLQEVVSTNVRTVKEINDLNKALSSTDDHIGDFEESIKDAGGSLQNLERNRIKLYNEEKQAQQRREQALKDSLDSAKSALGGFGDALISSERSFSKYNSVIGSGTDALSSMVSILGPLGKAFSVLVKLIGLVAQGAANQADSLVSATDTLKSMGTAGAFTSEEFLNLANNAGVASSNFEILTKPIKSLGSSILALGTSAGDSAISFMKLTNVSEEERMRMRRLGVDQEELIQTQADFVKLQQLSGVQLSSRYRTEDQLRKASLEYVTNLKELSSLTGEDVETLKKRQQEMAAQAEFQIRTLQLQEKESQLREQGLATGNEELIAEADRIKAQIDAEEAARNLTASFGDPRLTQGMTELLTTGGSAISEVSGYLRNAIPDIDSYLSRIREGDKTAAAEMMESFKDNMINIAASGQGEAAILSAEYRENVLFMSDELLAKMISMKDIDISEGLDNAADDIRTASEEAFDVIISGRARLTETEIAAAVAMDQILYPAAEILSSGFIKLNEVVTDLTMSFDKLLGFIPGYESRTELEGDIASEQETLEEYRQELAEAEQDTGWFSSRRQSNARSGMEGALARQAEAAVKLLEKGGTVEEDILQQTIDRLERQLERTSEVQSTGDPLTDAHLASTGGIYSPETREELQRKIDILRQATPALPVARPAQEVPQADYMSTIAELESGGNPNARASTSSASGMYQITDNTWNNSVSQMGKDWTLADKNDPAKQEEVVRYLYDQQKTALERALGRIPNDQEMYMAHFLGQSDAIKLLRSVSEGGSENASSLLPNAAGSNPAIFREGMTAEELYTEISNRYNAASRRVSRDRESEMAFLRSPRTELQVPRSTTITPESDTQVNNTTTRNPVTTRENETPTDRMIVLNEQLMTMISQKLDIVIEKLGDSVDIQDRSFRYNSV